MKLATWQMLCGLVVLTLLVTLGLVTTPAVLGSAGAPLQDGGPATGDLAPAQAGAPDAAIHLVASRPPTCFVPGTAPMDFTWTAVRPSYLDLPTWEAVDFKVMPPVGPVPVYTDSVSLPAPAQATRSGTFTPTLNVTGVLTAEVRYRSSNWNAYAGLEFTLVYTDELDVFKFRDDNGNGNRDPGEPPVTGWTITLTAPSGTKDTKKTDGNGRASWQNLPRGDYTVTEETRPGWKPTRPVPVGVPVRVTVNPCQTSVVTFLNQPTGNIIAPKFEDINGDGVWNNGEPAVPGWSITLTAPDGTTDTKKTDGTAGVVWLDLTPGQYTLTEETRPAWRPTTPTSFVIDLHGGETVTRVFGNQRLGSLRVFKFDDKNFNQQQDPGELPIAGWLMTVTPPPTYTLSSAIPLSQNTDQNGWANWDDKYMLPVGNYIVSEERKPGWELDPRPVRPVVVKQGQTAEERFGNRLQIINPKALTVDPLSHLLYITSRPQPALTASTGYVLRVSADDTHLIDITGKIPVGINPWGIGITGNQAYVANFGDSSPCRPTDGTRGVDGSVARIDLPGFTVAQTVTLAGIDPSTGKKQSSAPTFIGINPNTGRIYTPLSTAGQLAVLDGNLRLLTKIAADEGAFGVAVDPGTNRIYVSSRDARSISIIDGTSNKITGKIDLLAGTKTLPGMPPPNAPYALALDPGLGLFYVSIDPQPTYNGIDPCHAAEGWPRAVGNPRQVWIYQTSGNNRIDVLNVREGGDNGGTGIAVNPQNHHVFVTNCKDNTVSRFNGAESPPLNVTTITNPLFNCPSSVAVDSAFGRVFIGNRETTNPNPPPLNEAVIVLSDR